MKRFATIAVLIAMVGGSVFAQAKWGGIARHVAMGGTQFGAGLVLNPYIYEDPAFLLVNPAYHMMYSDYGWMNVGGGTLTTVSTGDNGYNAQNAGVAFQINNQFVLGGVFSYDPSAVNAIGGLIGTIAQRPTQAPHINPDGTTGVRNVWELVGAFDLGNIDLGLSFMYGNSKFDTTHSGSGHSAEVSSRMFGGRLGVLVDIGGGSSLDFSGQIRLDKATDKLLPSTAAGTAGDYSATATEFVFNGRGKLHVSNTFNFVPYGYFSLVTAEPKEDAIPTGGTATTTAVKVSALAFAIGVGGEYRTAHIYLAGGLSYQNVRAKVEATTTAAGVSATTTVTATYQGLPVVNVGGEWWFTDWLAGRAGYQRSIATAKLKVETPAVGPVPGVTTESNRTVPHSFIAVGGLGPFNNDGVVNLGLGFKLGNFALDATVSEEALRRGLGLIGSQDNLNTFGYITTSYSFQ